jgi:hypothetical protein
VAGRPLGCANEFQEHLWFNCDRDISQLTLAGKQFAYLCLEETLSIHERDLMPGQITNPTAAWRPPLARPTTDVRELCRERGRRWSSARFQHLGSW